MSTFRGMFAAASLKLFAERSGCARPPDFPRHVCRGLIEATTTHKTPAERPNTFRGMFAAASLKPCRDQVGPNDPLTFRGMFAAASLKQLANDWNDIEAGATFRGMFAAASLKRRHNPVIGAAGDILSAACLPRPH